ncbi:uncharacterized protein LOC116779225 [Danaus plexippus]|uniref:uncharacterized protein LOC116779225 n=1 Tax=Danaus plexippus TaxID=13037 RepID=UPI002AB19357|nr:uncharacterized protein LOC116779225 [Danaus plexippus]XP_061385896.1 uncharacterized protein LOC116779225 [Danaus plexippus]
MKWIHAKDGHAPLGALMAGFTAFGEPIFIARARHERALIPGKLIHSHGCAYVSWGGLEFKKYEYEVLMDEKKQWIATSGNKIPLNAYPGGKTENHEVLFIGRVVGYKGETTPGKVQASQKVLYIPWGGKEISFSDYEILCR